MLASPEGVKEECGAFSAQLTDCVAAPALPAPSFNLFIFFIFKEFPEISRFLSRNTTSCLRNVKFGCGMRVPFLEWLQF
jgi:hypothetical protein